MPLVIISGLPCSGKTTRAHELAQYLRNNLPSSRAVEIISAEHLGTSRTTDYADATAEKKVRGNFISAIERRLSRDRIIIADGLNYIKGYRYQLYCVAREAQTPHCVLQCVVSERLCRERNHARADLPEAYPKDIFEELLLRYEEPNNQARWDSPLFTVGPEGDGKDEWAQILAALLGNVLRPPSMSTAPKTAVTDSGLLMQLDNSTQQVVQTILDQVKTEGVPCEVVFGGSDDSMTLKVTKTTMASDLQRLRRQFIHMNRLHQVQGHNVTSLFIGYLQDQLNN